MESSDRVLYRMDATKNSMIHCRSKCNRYKYNSIRITRDGNKHRCTIQWTHYTFCRSKTDSINIMSSRRNNFYSISSSRSSIRIMISTRYICTSCTTGSNTITTGIRYRYHNSSDINTSIRSNDRSNNTFHRSITSKPSSCSMVRNGCTK